MSAKPRAPREPLPFRGAFDTYSAAEYLSISRSQLQQLIADGHIASFTPRGMKRLKLINVEELDRYRLESAADARSADVIDLGKAS